MRRVEFFTVVSGHLFFIAGGEPIKTGFPIQHQVAVRGSLSVDGVWLGVFILNPYRPAR